jgi:anti-sigma factor RsiW
MNGPCEEYADKIVDYIDGELPEAEAESVAQHLAECERCRQMVQALDRSLGLAKALWSDNRGGSGKRSLRSLPMVHRTHRTIGKLACAASILLVASLLALVIPNHYPQEPSIRLEDLERQVARAGTAAELLAATRIVAQCEGTECIVERQYRYILREYANTPAAKTIRADLGLGGTQ